MTIRAPDVSRLFALWLAVGVAAVVAGCRGSDASTDVVDVAFASRSQRFEDCCKHQFPPGRHRDECVDEARHGRCRLDCRPPHDAGAPDRHMGSPDAATRDGGADGPAGSLDAAPDASGTNCSTLTITPNVVGTISVGETIELFVGGTGASGSFSWSTTGEAGSLTPLGGFADFLCTGAGTETVSIEGAGSCSINLTCSFCGDGIVESGEDCDPPNLTPDGRILCDNSCHFIGTCGNGRLDPGEQCDPPNPGFCGNDCQIAPVCGDGIIGPGEQCDPPHQGPDGLQCGANCQLLTCGNGVIDPGEQCDPPKSSGTAPLCSQTCQIPTCGNGVVDPGETCDPPTAGVCDSSCQSIPIVCGNGIIQPGETCDFPNQAICNQCQLTTCGGCYFQAIGGDPGCLSLTGTARTTCQGLLSCMASGLAGCFFLPGGTGNTACFCSDATCSAGANGRCALQFEAVAGSTDPTVVLQQLNDPTSLLSRVRNEGKAFANFPGCGMFCRSL